MDQPLLSTYQMHKKPRILLAEDDLNLGILLVDYLESEGFNVTLVRDGIAALVSFETSNYNLCLLDIMMPKMDGFALAEAIRKQNTTIPLLFITAKSLKPDKLKGYEIGADDYITKPFDEEELLWKIKAILRRAPKPAMKKPSIGHYQFDVQNQALIFDGKMRRITEKESDILQYLLERPNRVIKREEMLEELWGENDYFLGRSLDVFLTKMRKYLKDDTRISIENVYGVGFIFNVPEEF